MVKNYSQTTRAIGAAAAFVEERQARGSVHFTLPQLLEATGLSTKAARNQLARLGYRVVRASPRKDFFLIVSPEQRPMGGPPVLWWIDAFFKAEERPYYVGLLSAAAEYGATHQAVQEVQVVTSRPGRVLRIGRMRVRFLVKRNVGQTPVSQPAQAYAPVRLSTPEATALDLLRYAHRIGGIGRAAEAIRSLLPRFRAPTLRQALQAEAETSNIQRLGYVLEHLERPDLCRVVEAQLPARRSLVFLEQRKPLQEGSVEISSRRWAVVINGNLEESA